MKFFMHRGDIDQNYYLLTFVSMSLNKRPLSKKANHPFPFSGYVLKSYSTENGPFASINARQMLGGSRGVGKEGSVGSKLSLQKEEGHQSIRELNKYLNVLEINTKVGKMAGGNHSTEFRRTESKIYKVKEETSIVSTPIKVGLAKAEGRPKAKVLSPVKKPKVADNPRIVAALRYHLVTLYSLLGRRQDFLSSLRGKGQMLATPLRLADIQQRLAKFQEGKGRDKGRVKFNYITSEQLRSIKYKAKATNISSSPSKKEEKEKVQYDDDEEDGSQAEEREDMIDFGTWKRRNGAGINQKVFIIKGGYAELRRGLIQRGWFENQDVWSPHYDFKWTTRICDINYLGLKHSQAVNHFNNNHHLTSKYGITRRLRSLPLAHGVDSDRFYPRCYDLGDQTDFQNFLEQFKFTFAESVTKRFLIDKQRYRGLQLKVRTAYAILKRRTVSLSVLSSTINKGEFPSITAEQWAIITQTSPKQEQQRYLQQLRQKQQSDIPVIENPEEEGYEGKVFEAIDGLVRTRMQILARGDPQQGINGMRNVWIAKPNFMSRGRGIRCFNNLYDIADYALGQPTQFVVQKYIENPLLIQGRKFDIRQWVLIQDFAPPKIWFYQQCYLRFTNDEYSLDNIYNRFAHLTNNSIQKYSKKHDAQKSMWQQKEFADWIGAEQWTLLQQKMKNIVVWSVKSCEGHVMAKKGSAELVGYDFMIDQNLNPWLIEINMSPAMDYSTPVTKKLVKMVLQDTAKLLTTSKKGKNVGSFTCIYKGDQDLPNYPLYNL